MLVAGGGAGLPAFVRTAHNTWTVIPLGGHRCCVTLLQAGGTSRHLADDLRQYVGHGTPSPLMRPSR